jgi:hypothetical protein
MTIKEQYAYMDNILFNEHFELSRHQRADMMHHVFAEDTRITTHAYFKMLDKINERNK